MNYELYHHGILGMKWGIRRYQNKDGTLTPAGRKRMAENAARVGKRERELDRAKWYKRDKAREKRDKALDKYDRFVKKLDYNTMSDEEVLKAVKNFKANNAVSAVVTTKNVQRGERSLEQKIALLNSVFQMGSSAVNLMSGIRKFSWDAQDRNAKKNPSVGGSGHSSSKDDQKSTPASTSTSRRTSLPYAKEVERTKEKAYQAQRKLNKAHYRSELARIKYMGSY